MLWNSSSSIGIVSAPGTYDRTNMYIFLNSVVPFIGRRGTGIQFCDSFWSFSQSDSSFQILLEFSLKKKFQYHYRHRVRTHLCPRAEAGLRTPEDTSSTPLIPTGLLPNPRRLRGAPDMTGKTLIATS